MTQKKLTKKKTTKKQKNDPASQRLLSTSVSRIVIPKKIINAVGRPTKYTKSMCVQVIDLMSQGLSKENAAIMMGLSIDTFWKWIDKYSEFSEAVNIGQNLSELWWMEMGRRNIMNKDFNSTLYMMNMQNRFGWTRKLEGKLTTETIEKKEISIQVQTDDAIAEIARVLAESGAIKSGIEKVADSEIN